VACKIIKKKETENSGIRKEEEKEKERHEGGGGQLRYDLEGGNGSKGIDSPQI